MRKGVVYSKELGSESDRVEEHSIVIFPFITNTGKAGSPRSDFQFRIPIDDTHTYHISYQVYSAPAGVTVPPQEVIPYYEPPTVDERGRPMNGAALVREPEFDDRVVAETRALLAQVAA